MVRTQIQIPDDLYRRLKQHARAREWTFAETLRRGAETLLAMAPREPLGASEWTPPPPRKLGCLPLDNAALKRAAQEDDIRL